MALTDGLFEKRLQTIEHPSVPLSDAFDFMPELGGIGVGTAAGRRVNQQTAKQYSAVYAAIQMISGTVGTLPLKLYQRRDDGGKDEVRGHPLFSVLHATPNPEMAAISFREAGQSHLLTRGNFYAEVVRDGGRVVELWPLPPDKTERKRRPDGTPFFVTKPPRSEPIRLSWDQVLHIPGLGFDGKRGWSVISLARESIGLGLATEEHGARLFQNAAVPRGVLTTPNTLDADAAERLKERWEAAQGGLRNAHRVAVLEEDLKWQDIGFSAEDAQFLDTRRFQVREIARWFNLPPHKIRDMQAGEPNSLDEQNLEYLQDTIQPWLTRWEQAITHQLLTEREREQGLFAEFNVDALLRSDAEKRANMYNVRFQTGSMSPNDIRAKENENPIPGGDQHFVQLNMVPLSQADSISSDERALLLAAEKGDAETIRAVSEARRTNEPEQRVGVEQRSVQQRRRLVNAFKPLFEDAMGRMTRAERQDLRSEMGRIFAEDGPGGFMDFLAFYYSREFPDTVKRILGPTFISYAEAVAGVAAEQVNTEPNDAEVQQFVEGPDGYTETFAKRYSAASRKQLQATIREARKSPDADPQEEVERRLDEWENGTDEGRPRHIVYAENEVNQEGNAVSKAVFAAAGVQALRWLSIGDSCPYCEALNGTVVSITQPFLEVGEDFEPYAADRPLTVSRNVGHPPAHWGCDCLLMPSQV